MARASERAARQVRPRRHPAYPQWTPDRRRARPAARHSWCTRPAPRPMATV